MSIKSFDCLVITSKTAAKCLISEYFSPPIRLTLKEKRIYLALKTYIDRGFDVSWYCLHDIPQYINDGLPIILCSKHRSTKPVKRLVNPAYKRGVGNAIIEFDSTGQPCFIAWSPIEWK